MILEAIGVVAASVTVITVASLWLVSVVDKREREDDEADVQIRPFEEVGIGTLCPICGRPGKNASMPFGAEGPSVRRCAVRITSATCGVHTFT